MNSIRVIDLGLVSPLRSQAAYHAVAYAQRPGTPDTLMLVAPTDPYVCIGCHQELQREVDVDYCRAAGLPIYRREVGGGAVLLDRGQVFTQWIFHRHALPAALEERFALYITPLVDTYRSLGIEATHRPINDIHVRGRKIGGTGAAQIGEAEVVVGSLMFGFNVELMARVLKVASEKMRDKIYQALSDYMTTMTRELGRAPDRDRVVREYLSQVARALGRAIEPGELDAAELEALAEQEARLASDEWLNQKGGLKQAGAVKIHQDVHVAESTHKAPGGLIRATMRVREGRIDDLALAGDFTMLPASAVATLERAMRGLPLDAAAINGRVAEVYRETAAQSPGVSTGDWVTAVMAAAGQPQAREP